MMASVIIMNDISARLFEAIKKSKYSYGELAKLTGMPKSAIQRYATGSTDKIPIDRLQALAAVLGTTAEQILGWETPAVDAALAAKHAEINEIFDRMPPELRTHALALLKGLAQPAPGPDDRGETD